VLALASGACDVTLVRGLTSHEAEELSSRLQSQGVAVNLTQDATSERLYQLDVADGAVAHAVEVLGPTSAQKAPTRSAARPLIPTPDAERREHEALLIARITEALQKFPGIRHASVELALPSPSVALSDLLHAPVHTPPSVQVTLVLSPGQASLAGQVSTLVPTWVPELAGAAINVNETEAGPLTDCAALSHIGPLTVTSASLPTLRGWLTASLLLHMLTALALLALLRRRSRARNSREMT